jgi:hypothetical protein
LRDKLNTKTKEMIELKDCYQAFPQNNPNVYWVYKNGHKVSVVVTESEERAIKLYKREEVRKSRISNLIATHISMENAMFGL